MAHPLVRDMKREGQEIAARLHIEYDEAGHAHDPQFCADAGCRLCKVHVREAGPLSSGLYAFDGLPKPISTRDDAEVVQACRIVLASAVNGEVWPDMVPVAGGLLGAALAKLKAQGKMERSETEHRPSRKKGAGSRRVYKWRVRT